MAGQKDKRKELLSFIDRKAFDVILKTAPGKFKDQDREKFEDIRRKTENEKKQFHEEYKTAEEVKDNFLSDVRSESAKKVNKELEHLKLPTLPGLKDEFMDLCEKLGVK